MLLNNMYVQVYDSSGATVGNETSLSSTSSTTNINRTLTVGQEYYIRVKPFSSCSSGTYKIAFNASTTALAL
ncbi:MAG: hypothetical protein LBV17_03435 [Treponema sp.]|nr:hypothetical protein [Treponema sp.]